MLDTIDEEGDMKNAVGMEMAKVNAVIAKKLPQERIRRNPKSTNEISLENNKFVGIGGWERFTCSGAPSYGYLILKDAFKHHFSRVSRVMVDLTHSWSRRTSPVLYAAALPNFFGLERLCFFPSFAMDQICFDLAMLRFN